MSVLVTGSSGFLGWHLKCSFMASGHRAPAEVNRENWDQLIPLIDANDSVIHLAAVNRVTGLSAEQANEPITRSLVTAISTLKKPITFINANSIHSNSDTDFGEMKRNSAQRIREVVEEFGGVFIDVVIPNVFGEHGVPDYHSFIATFSRDLWGGAKPNLISDSPVELIHAGQVSRSLIELLSMQDSKSIRLEGECSTPRKVHSKLEEFWRSYRDGVIPKLDSAQDVRLFNTFRSIQSPIGNPMFIDKHEDQRGYLQTIIRSKSEGQVFVSNSKPGVTRGQHFHIEKIERFCVLQGNALIRMRKLFSSEVIEIRVSADKPISVDMPTLWSHSITNLGDSDLVTMFWTMQEYNEEDSDTFPEEI